MTLVWSSTARSVLQEPDSEELVNVLGLNALTPCAVPTAETSEELYRL